MSRYTHFCMDIRRALKQRNLKGMLTDEGRELSDAEVRDTLIEALRAGKDYYAGCDNMTPDGRCAGHDEDATP